jgi:thioredoxin 1
MIKVIKLGTPWCGPCRQMTPTVKKLQENYQTHEDVIIQDINIEEDNQLATEYNVRSIPTTLFFQNDVLVEKKTGVLKLEQLEEIINKYKS